MTEVRVNGVRYRYIEGTCIIRHDAPQKKVGTSGQPIGGSRSWQSWKKFATPEDALLEWQRLTNVNGRLNSAVMLAERDAVLLAIDPAKIERVAGFVHGFLMDVTASAADTNAALNLLMEIVHKARNVYGLCHLCGSALPGQDNAVLCTNCSAVLQDLPF